MVFERTCSIFIDRYWFVLLLLAVTRNLFLFVACHDELISHCLSCQTLKASVLYNLLGYSRTAWPLRCGAGMVVYDK
jgi:hypothetical protein